MCGQRGIGSETLNPLPFLCSLYYAADMSTRLGTQVHEGGPTYGMRSQAEVKGKHGKDKVCFGLYVNGAMYLGCRK